MEIEISKNSYCRIKETDSSSESQFDIKQDKRTILSFFRRKKSLKKITRSEIAKIPNDYWQISSEQFERALNLRPQLKLTKSASFSNVHDYNFNLYDNFNSVGNILENVGNEESKCKKRVKFSALMHFKSFIHSKQQDVVINVFVMGDSGVGKTSIVQRFVHGTLPKNNKELTPDYEKKLIRLQNNTQFCLHIFKISGPLTNGIFTSIGNSDSIGAMIVFDVHEPKSFSSVKKWKHDLDAKSLQSKRNRIPCLLLANKCDSAKAVFDMCNLDNFCLKLGISAWYDISATNDFNIKNSFVCLLQKVLEEQNISPMKMRRNKKKRRHLTISFRKKSSQYDEECTTIL